MNLNQFLAELAERGIKLWVEGDTLRFRAPKGAMTSEERDLLVLHKAKVISLLSQNNTSANGTSQTIVPVSEQRDIPLSFPQEQLWFLTELEPNNTSYNELFALRLLGWLNIVALEQSLNKIVARHAALRTNFTTVNGQPVQVIAESLILAGPVIDLSNLPASDREVEVQRLATEQAQKPFNLVSDPLIQTTVFKLTETEHILLLKIHHIIWDGWSLGILLQELEAFYSAFCNNLSLELPSLPLQYPDYAVWQRQYLTGEVLNSQRAYWQQQLLDAPALLELPTDRVRGITQTFRGAHQRFALSKELTENIISLSRRQKVTLFMTLLAAFQTLLYRYTGQSDLCVGTPIANRDRAEFKGLIGFFVNTLVLRTSLSENPSFEDLLSRVRKVTLGAYANRNLPFEKLVEILQPERSLSYTPLAQVMLVLLDELPEIQMGGLTVSPLAVETGMARFDLVLCVEQTASGLIGEWEYNTDLFDDATIARMTRHFQTLLEAIAANPQQKISQLPLLTPAERHQIHEWNNTWAEYPQDKCIHQLFEEQVERTPDAVALVFEGEQLTYGELNRRANKLANYLQSLGVGSEVLVGICVDRSFGMIVGILGILKAGGAYVPIDPAYPSERIAYMLDDSQLPVLLTQQKLVASLPEHQAQVICLDSNWEEISTESDLSPITSVAPENLAYVIYTSGSTGKPKGVGVPHRAVNRLVINTNYIYFQPLDVVAFASNFSFDAATFEIWGALLNGAKLVVITKDVALSPDEFVAQIHSQGITVLFLTTALFNLLAREVPSALRSVRHLLFGGEAVEPKWVKEILKKGFPQRLLHVYGPTENTTFTSWYLVEDVSEEATTIPIGRPIANTQVYLLDTQLQPVPLGVSGEIYIGGDGLARGYLNRPDLTDEKFIPNPFSNQPGSRLYKTGDVARYLPDGNIEFLGRIDNQVKIRGFRIELGEIEATLIQHPAIRETVVVATENTTDTQQLVAYLVPPTEVLLSISDLRHFLKQQLPDYMIPSAFVTLEHLPLTPNGKVDRRALPAPEIRPELELTFVAPRTPLEEILANIWAEVLGIKQIGINDNFFSLGGHSLLATQIISRIGTSLAVEVPLRHLFESPTIASLAEQIQILLSNENSVQRPPILPVQRTTEIPLSFAQARLWFLDQLQPGSGFYNIPNILRLNGQLNISALENSINEIIIRHEALRTNFTTQNSKPVQIIQESLKLKLPIIDLESLSKEEREIETKRLVTQLANQPFNLQQEPLLRSFLLKLGEQNYIFVLVLHHIIADGWSIEVLERELSTIYTALCNNQTPVLPELPIQYADFAVWQRNWLTGEVLETQLDYWQQQLKGIPALLELPTDRSRPAIQSYRGAHQSFQLPVELSKGIISLCKRMGVTPFMLLLAAFKTLLYRLSGQDDIVVGTPVANRHYHEIEGLIGYFVNTLALRASNLSLNSSFEELLNQVREVTLGAYTHQDMPFEELVELLHPERSLSHSPIFQVMFGFENESESNLSLPGLNISPMAVEFSWAKFELDLSFQNNNNGLIGLWEYNTDLFDHSTIARITDYFQALLSGIVANPKLRISELPLLNATQQHQLLIEWNHTQKYYPQYKCIHQLFEGKVELTPDAVAVNFEEEKISYGELNAKANQLAHYLQTLGVKPEVLVGICVERSLEMIIGLLGILKAGGAYVPIDPAYPKERLAFMLEDSSVPVLLTQQKLLEKLPPNSARVVCLDSDGEEIYCHSQENPSSEVKPENLAYVIYTSGSTGKPKGVLIEHKSLVNYTTVAIAEYQIEKSDRILQFSSISFDVSAEEIYTSLASGATLVLRTDTMLDSFEGFLQKCQNWEITVLALPTAYWHELTPFLSQKTLALPPSLRLVILGGEKALPERLKTWFECVGQQVGLLNNYGPTEATIGATIYGLSVDDAALRELPIGRPLGNVCTYILDRNQQPVPIGVPGELHIGGVGLARGYLNRPELTQEKFISNPFSNEPGSRLYKTGDWARYLPDGNIEYMSRIDNQVKIRGFRVELGEIEAILAKHPNVRSVTVLDREDAPGNKRLVAYLVSNLIPDRIPYHSECQLELNNNAIAIHTQDISTGGVGLVGMPAIEQGKSVRVHMQLPGESEPRWLSGTVVWSRPPQAGIRFHLTPNEQAQVEQSVDYQLDTQDLWKTLQRTVARNLRDYLKQKLPDYMIPSAFVLLKALPLSPNGKIDRRALPVPDSFSFCNKTCLVAPHDTVELQLSQIWSEVLGVDSVGVQDNFFTLGGHSLLAVRLMARLEQQFGKNLPLATLFSSPTIEQLAIHLRSSTDSGNWSPLIPIQSSGSKRPFFCVPGVGGNVLYFYELARHLGSDQPFYGLQARGLDGESEPFTQVEDMAACYIEAIQAVQSQGSYLLGGHSFGGVVAFEIAQQLQKQGHEVALVAIMDTVAPIFSKNLIGVNENELDYTEFASYMEYTFYPKWELSKQTLATLIREKQLDYLKEKWSELNFFPKDVASKSFRGLLEVYKANTKAHRNYCPKEVVPTQISVFRASTIDPIYAVMEELPELLKDPVLGWSDFSTIKETYVIPGNHMTMMQKPYVQVLAAQLKTSLKLAQKFSGFT
ncbi:amino acid adenylation domain-containing protein [Microcoleus sp. B7-D4]|uniref:amino acid adenylation domain-containing protein n=1 Tax=Microcoleus sp. B7-D4 TaxID=2818696 RepID=UPI002FD76D7B